MSSPQYNLRSSAVKRLMKEAEELREATKLFFAQPLEDNLFEWHFTVRGPRDSEFEKGLYHGRIILPSDYPMKPPNIILLTPNGRFETNKKICLSISGYHPESWQPSWSIRTALLAIIGFMPSHGGGSIGSLDYPVEERKKLALKSRDWLCPTCGIIKNKLIEEDVNSTPDTMHQEAKNLANQITFKGEGEKNSTTDSPLSGKEEILPQNEPTKSNSPVETKFSPTETNPSTTSPKDALIQKGNALLESLPSNSPGREMLNRRLEMLKRHQKDSSPITSPISTNNTNENALPCGSRGQNQLGPQRSGSASDALSEPSNGPRLLCLSNLLIIFIAAILLLLIGRRLYLANVWRFYTEGPTHDEI